jgi:hypothetical protein
LRISAASDCFIGAWLSAYVHEFAVYRTYRDAQEPQSSRRHRALARLAAKK